MAASATAVCLLGDDGRPRCTGGPEEFLGRGPDAVPSEIPLPVWNLDGVRSLTAAGTSMFALRADGTLWSWGNGMHDAFPPSAVPIVLDTPHRFRHIDAGASGIAAVSTNGRVYLSTTGSYGQFDFSVKAGLTTVTAVAVGNGFVCALRADGSLWCWGDNAYGQLGDGTHLDSPLTRVVGIDDAVSIAASHHTACALHADGRVSCWGENREGSLGTGSHLPADSPVPVDVVDIDRAVSITGAGDSTYPFGMFCVIGDDGTASCWGDQGSAELGPVPKRLDLEGATQVEVGGFVTTYVLLDDGTVVRSEDWSPPEDFTPIPGFHTGWANPDVATGYEHTCALRSDGTVSCWGDNVFGQLGDASTFPSNVPVDVDIDEVVEIAAWGDSSCAIRRDGTLWCWGNNQFDQLASNGAGFPFVAEPVEIVGLERVTAVAPGSRSICAVTEDARVWCWGDNGYGQLGIGSYAAQPKPVLVPGLDEVRSIDSSGIHTCAATADGRAWCWGNGFSGELGNGMSGQQSVNLVPKLVLSKPSEPLTDVIGIGAGHATSCATLAHGGAVCWGNDAHGLGDGAFGSEQLYPRPVYKVYDALDATLGSSAQCIRGAQGYVGCFGTNMVGELGDPTAPIGVDSSRPRLVGGPSTPLDRVIALDSGFDHTCAIRADGSIWCWGAGDRGQLGNGADDDHTTPVRALW